MVTCEAEVFQMLKLPGIRSHRSTDVNRSEVSRSGWSKKGE
jgi:hypothetical protein